MIKEGINKLNPSNYICKKGDPSNHIYILLSGSIQALSESGEVICNFEVSENADLDILKKNEKIAVLDLSKFKNYTILGEIGCLLNSSRSVTLRSSKEGAVIFCLSYNNSKLAAAILDENSFRMVLTNNVARYVKKANERLFKERKQIKNILDLIKLYQKHADRFIPEAENLLTIFSKNGFPFDEIRRILFNYKTYHELSNINLEEFKPVSLIGILEDEPSLKKFNFSETSNSFEKADFSTLIFDKGDIICSQNDQSDAIFFLIDGSVEVIVLDQILDVIDKPGIFIGEISTLLGYENNTSTTRTATLRAAEHTRLAIKKGSHFIKSIRHKPEVINILFKTLTEKLKKSDSILNDIFKKRRNFHTLLNNFNGPKMALNRIKTLCNKSADLSSEKKIIELESILNDLTPN